MLELVYRCWSRVVEKWCLAATPSPSFVRAQGPGQRGRMENDRPLCMTYRKGLVSLTPSWSNVALLEILLSSLPELALPLLTH